MSSASHTAEPARQGGGLLVITGRWSISMWRQLRGVTALLVDSVASLRGLDSAETFRQAHQLANRSIFFIVVIMSFNGVVMVHHAASQALNVIGDLSIIGPAFLELLIREFGPTIVALMISARYGAGVAAEIGAMQISEQVDALRMTGADPPGYLVAPRLVGSVLGILPIVILGTALSWIAGAYAGKLDFNIGWDTYFNTRLIGAGDVITGLCKTFAFGVAIPVVSCYAGLSAKGGAPGVGRATTWAVVGSSIAVLGLDLVIGAIGYVVFR